MCGVDAGMRGLIVSGRGEGATARWCDAHPLQHSTVVMLDGHGSGGARNGPSDFSGELGRRMRWSCDDLQPNPAPCVPVGAPLRRLAGSLATPEGRQTPARSHANRRLGAELCPYNPASCPKCPISVGKPPHVTSPCAALCLHSGFEPGGLHRLRRRLPARIRSTRHVHRCRFGDPEPAARRRSYRSDFRNSTVAFV